jgi:hypothetical protein
VTLVPLNSSALRFEVARRFAVAAIARTCAKSFAGNPALRLEAVVAGLAALGGCFMLCLRLGATSGFDTHPFGSLCALKGEQRVYKRTQKLRADSGFISDFCPIMASQNLMRRQAIPCRQD